MEKSKVLDWVEYAGKIITWLGGAVRSFPEKESEKVVRKSNDSANRPSEALREIRESEAIH